MSIHIFPHKWWLLVDVQMVGDLYPVVLYPRTGVQSMVLSESDGEIGDPVAIVLLLLIPLLVPCMMEFVIVFILLLELYCLVPLLVP